MAVPATRPVSDPGPCRFCGRASWRVDGEGPVHPCCAWWWPRTGRCPACNTSDGQLGKTNGRQRKAEKERRERAAG